MPSIRGSSSFKPIKGITIYGATGATGPQGPRGDDLYGPTGSTANLYLTGITLTGFTLITTFLNGTTVAAGFLKGITGDTTSYLRGKTGSTGFGHIFVGSNGDKEITIRKIKGTTAIRSSVGITSDNNTITINVNRYDGGYTLTSGELTDIIATDSSNNFVGVTLQAAKYGASSDSVRINKINVFEKTRGGAYSQGSIEYEIENNITTVYLHPEIESNNYIDSNSKSKIYSIGLDAYDRDVKFILDTPKTYNPIGFSLMLSAPKIVGQNAIYLWGAGMTVGFGFGNYSQAYVPFINNPINVKTTSVSTVAFSELENKIVTWGDGSFFYPSSGTVNDRIAPVPLNDIPKLVYIGLTGEGPPYQTYNKKIIDFDCSLDTSVSVLTQNKNDINDMELVSWGNVYENLIIGDCLISEDAQYVIYLTNTISGITRIFVADVSTDNIVFQIQFPSPFSLYPGSKYYNRIKRIPGTNKYLIYFDTGKEQNRFDYVMAEVSSLFVFDLDTLTLTENKIQTIFELNVGYDSVNYVTINDCKISDDGSKIFLSVIGIEANSTNGESLFSESLMIVNSSTFALIDQIKIIDYPVNPNIGVPIQADPFNSVIFLNSDETEVIFAHSNAMTSNGFATRININTFNIQRYKIFDSLPGESSLPFNRIFKFRSTVGYDREQDVLLYGVELNDGGSSTLNFISEVVYFIQNSFDPFTGFPNRYQKIQYNNSEEDFVPVTSDLSYNLTEKFNHKGTFSSDGVFVLVNTNNVLRVYADPGEGSYEIFHAIQLNSSFQSENEYLTSSFFRKNSTKFLIGTNKGIIYKFFDLYQSNTASDYITHHENNDITNIDLLFTFGGGTYKEYYTVSSKQFLKSYEWDSATALNEIIYSDETVNTLDIDIDATFTTPESKPTRIIRGWGNAVIIQKNKQIYGWGLDNGGDITNIPTGVTGVIDIVSITKEKRKSKSQPGNTETTLPMFGYIGLKDNGTIFSWGNGNTAAGGSTLFGGLFNNVSSITGGIQLASSGHHLVILREVNGIRGVCCFGLNTSGQCNVPSGLTLVKEVGCCLHGSYALKFDNTVEFWGATGWEIPSEYNNKIKKLFSPKSETMMALDNQDRIVAWHGLTYGFENYEYPSSVYFKSKNTVSDTKQFTLPPPKIEDIEKVVCGYFNTAYLLKNKKVYMSPYVEGLYFNATISTKIVPETTYPNPTISYLYSPLAGIGAEPTNLRFRNISTVNGINAVPYKLNNNIKDVFPLPFYTFAIKEDNTLIGWGNESNSLLDQANTFQGGFVINAIKGSNGVIDIPINQGHTGSGGTPPSHAIKVAGGLHHSCAIKLDGTVECWGANYKNQCNVPSGLNNVVDITCGWYHTIALKNDGTIVAWGSNEYGESSLNPLWPKMIKISSSRNHNVFIGENFKLYGSGLNDYLQIPTSQPNQNGDTSSNNVYIDVSTGFYHTIALKQDQKISIWGEPDATRDEFLNIKKIGQITYPNVLSANSISAGGYHNAILYELPSQS